MLEGEPEFGVPVFGTGVGLELVVVDAFDSLPCVGEGLVGFVGGLLVAAVGAAESPEACGDAFDEHLLDASRGVGVGAELGEEAMRGGVLAGAVLAELGLGSGGYLGVGSVGGFSGFGNYV